MKLPHLLGNERLKAALAALPPSGVGSAVLLDGPAGIGKRTAAADLAAGLVCPEQDGPCGVCPSCRRASAGSHPDLIWLKEPEPGKGVRLEQVRALRAQSFLRPSEAPFKVFVIPGADRLNPPSQNALLKVLEEPASSVFVLLCENREAMLQTVRSRCKTFRLAPLPRRCCWTSSPGGATRPRTGCGLPRTGREAFWAGRWTFCPARSLRDRPPPGPLCSRWRAMPWRSLWPARG